MKRNFKLVLIAALLLSAPLLMFAQSPPHPNNNSGAPGSGNTPVGAGAPIGNGTFILLTLAMAYSAWKVQVLRPAAEE